MNAISQEGMLAVQNQKEAREEEKKRNLVEGEMQYKYITLSGS